MVLLEFSMFPIGKGESGGKHVKGSVDLVEKSRLPSHFHAMGTVIEGEWDEVFGVVRQCDDKMKKSCPRVSVSLKVDARKGWRGGSKKTLSVEKRLGRRLRTEYFR